MAAAAGAAAELKAAELKTAATAAVGTVGEVCCQGPASGTVPPAAAGIKGAQNQEASQHHQQYQQQG